MHTTIQTYDGGVLVSTETVPYTWDMVRAERVALLERSDIEINKAQDAGDTVAEIAWRAYRVALRNITSAFESAADAEWPEVPTA